ncbi:MAG TPA: DUF6798 domain-containing protein [Terracidiphilus sp.]|nr:DUF6798 domain-containing protein [Terracidiphilus sp.]
MISRSATPAVLIFSLLGFAAMGYHPGAEDDAVYLAAVNARLNPALFPHDAPFFQLQMHASLFDNFMAAFVRATHVPLAWAELLLQILSITLMVWASWTIVSRLFKENSARWGGVAIFSAMLTLPVAGTALYIADQYLHPRNLATALILIAVGRIVAATPWHAVPLLVLACLLHPMMGAYGISFCCILALTLSETVRRRLANGRPRLTPQPAAVVPTVALVPFAWLLQRPSQSWIDIMSTRHFLWLYKWTWYEWLGAIGPLLLFWLVARAARLRGDLVLACFATAVLIYGALHQAIAMIVLAPRSLTALCTLEPMRYLHLVYILMTLIGGAYLGSCVLRAHALRWFAFLLAAFGGMFFIQQHLFAATEHIELPSRTSANPWLQAFAWIRTNTPQNAYFAVDPNYMAIPGEDRHSFRALAERSVLADNIKDASVLSKAPQLVPVWSAQVHALSGWNHFQLAGFERLKARFGVTSVLVTNPPPEGLNCPWHNTELAVCRIP